MFRSQDGNYLPGPAVRVSDSLVTGIAPPAFEEPIEDGLGVAGDCNSDPKKAPTVIIVAAKSWWLVEALERRNGTSKVVSRVNGSTMVWISEETTRRIVRFQRKSLAGGVGSKDTRESSVPIGSRRKERRGRSPRALYRIC